MREWEGRAECRNHDPEMWFDDRARKAQEICLSCPVARECLQYAIKMGYGDGVWGGLSPSGRRMFSKAQEDRIRRA